MSPGSNAAGFDNDGLGSCGVASPPRTTPPAGRPAHGGRGPLPRRVRPPSDARPRRGTTTKRPASRPSSWQISSRAAFEPVIRTFARRAAGTMLIRRPTVVALEKVCTRRKVTSCSVITERAVVQAGAVLARLWTTSHWRFRAMAGSQTCSENNQWSRLPGSAGAVTIPTKSSQPSAPSAAAPLRLVTTSKRTSRNSAASAGTHAVGGRSPAHPRRRDRERSHCGHRAADARGLATQRPVVRRAERRPMRVGSISARHSVTPGYDSATSHATSRTATALHDLRMAAGSSWLLDFQRATRRDRREHREVLGPGGFMRTAARRSVEGPCHVVRRRRPGGNTIEDSQYSTGSTPRGSARATLAIPSQSKSRRDECGVPADASLLRRIPTRQRWVWD